MTRLVQVAINAVALLFAALLVPGMKIAWGDAAGRIVLTLAVLALVFGLVNTFVRPIAKLVAVPLNVATLGFFSILLNAGLLLIVATIVDLAADSLITIGDYPPDLTVATVATAAAAALIISIVSTSLNVIIPEP